jgi:beta propeller repeat protein
MEITALHDYGEYSSVSRFTISVPLRVVDGWPRNVPGMLSSPVAVADIDNDGLPEILAGCANKRVYAWKNDGSVVPGWPVFAGETITGKPAVCDINVDGKPDIIIASRDGKVYAFSNDGVRLDGWPQQTGGPILSSPLLSDIDDDGMVEVICGSSDGKVYAWNEDGKAIKGWPVEVGGLEIWMSPAAADIDGDHIAEVVVGGYGGSLYVLTADGKVLDGWPVPVGRGCGRGSPCIADFDGDGSLDIAVSGLFANSVYLVGIDGKIKDGWPRWPYNCGGLSAPIPADIDNDGLPEVAVATSCGTIVAWNADGSECKAVSGMAAHAADMSEPLFVDLDGNDTIEGIVGTAGGDSSEIDAFGIDGRVLGFPIRFAGRVSATPAVADVDDDGSMEIIVATTTGDMHMWRFVGAQPAGRVEYSQSRGDVWNTGIYGFTPNANVPLADLAVGASDISVEPAKPMVGDSLRISVTVANKGHWAAGGFDVNLYHDTESDSTWIASAEVAGLAAKRNIVLSFGWRVPGGEASRLMLVTLDSRDDVLELSELNNRAGKRFYLAVADLELTLHGVDPFPIVLGDSIVVRATLRNIGEDAATGFRLAFYDSAVADDRRFAVFGVDALLPGDSLLVAPRHRIDRFSGDYDGIWGVADPGNVVLEYHKSNNTDRFEVNSGISGDLVTAADYTAISGMAASRSHVAASSPQGHQVFVLEAEQPYNIVFEAIGTDVDISRKAVVFSTGGDIVGYDMADSMMFVVSTSPDEETQPVIWGDKVAWVSNSPERTDLIVRRAAADAETVRTSSIGGISAPDISYNLLVWQERGSQGYDVMGYDLAGDSIVVVCADEGDQENPSVYGNFVVWEDHSSDGGDVSGMDLATGLRTDIVRRPGLQINPEISGDIVVWQDSRNGGWDIYGYSLTDGIEFPICRQRDDQIMPSVSDSTVYWVDKRRPVDAILGLAFGGPRSVADIRRFETLSQDGQISLLVDVHEHSDAVTYRFYRYPDGRPMSDDRMAHIRKEFRLGRDSVYVFPDTSVAARRPFYYTLGVTDGYGEETFHGPVSGWAYAPVPQSLLLGNPFPNPCRGEVAFNFGVPRKSVPAGDTSWSDPTDHPRAVNVGVYTVSGRLVRTIEAGAMIPGYYRFEWDGRDESGRSVGPGIYFIHTGMGGQSLSRKVILLR